MPDPDDTSFRVLKALDGNPHISQRGLAREARVSSGAVNYCLRALREKGLVKMRNLHASNSQLRYAYVLTPNGLPAKAALTRHLLERKLADYAALRLEIEDARRDLDDADDLGAEPSNPGALP